MDKLQVLDSALHLLEHALGHSQWHLNASIRIKRAKVTDAVQLTEKVCRISL